MKKLFAAGCCLLLALGMSACAPTRQWDVSEMEPSQIDTTHSNEVTMKISENPVEPDTETLTLTITNHSGLAYTYGYEPILEYSQNGVWYTVPLLEGACWNDLGILLPAGGISTTELPIQDFYGKLPRGSYRVVKRLYSDTGSAHATAGFEIA